MKRPTYPDSPYKIQLSFSHIIEDLEKKAAGPPGPRSDQARTLLQEIAPFPEFREGITNAVQVQQNADLIRRLMADYVPPALTHNEIKAISIPYRNIIFNHTERFRKILEAAGKDFDINIRDFDDHQYYVLNCCIILNKIYNTHLDFTKPLFYDIPTANGIIKHYRILYNADFLDILPTDRTVRLTEEDINLLMNNYENLDLWKQKFPKESWLVKGFVIMTLFDATVENAVSIFKERLLGLKGLDFQKSMESIFQSIYQIPDIKVGFTLFNPEEDRFCLAAFGQPIKSFIIPDHPKRENQEVLCLSSYSRLVEQKAYFAVSDTAEFRATNPESCLVNRFIAQDIQSFILAPVMKDQVLLGVLEVGSKQPRVLNSINANKLNVVMPFLTDTIERLVIESHNQVQAVIQDKFTTIHASVYWKFRAEAQKLINSRQAGKEYEIQDIVFADVYPLFGQIDIKGSSEARNQSVVKDLQTQLQTLLPLLQALQEQKELESFAEVVQQVEYFIEDLGLPLKASTEQHIINYLNTWVHGRLKQTQDPELSPLIDAYFRNTDKYKGAFHAYRRKYETTISRINEHMAGIMDDQQPAVQALFPHYYERFKTDGVEHNLYIGPSISPHHKFDVRMLYQLRSWQLEVLCEMAIAHQYLRPSLPYPMEVATLILVYNATISIRFRMDEKHFDVDGSYNARFETVKKRIDKAYIKHTQERITQEGKITIVYSYDADRQEYESYIALLQKRNLLDETLENFEVEDLQGVSGLKALRVGIVNQE